MYSSWKFPITYLIAHSAVKSKTLKTLIVDVIKELIIVGLCPKLTVRGQLTNNQSALKLLSILTYVKISLIILLMKVQYWPFLFRILLKASGTI